MSFENVLSIFSLTLLSVVINTKLLANILPAFSLSCSLCSSRWVCALLCDPKKYHLESVNNGYVKKLIQNRNESDYKDRITKKVRIHFQWLNHRNFMVKHALLWVVLYWMHVSEDKTCWNNLCWSVEIVFTLKERKVGSVTVL